MNRLDVRHLISRSSHLDPHLIIVGDPLTWLEGEKLIIVEPNNGYYHMTAST